MAYSRRIFRGISKHDIAAGNIVRYLAEFITLSCAPDMLTLRLFPNGKEISESFGAYTAARYKIAWDLKDPTITVVAVGDGRTPRTAGTFALRSAWTCHSVDPQLKGRRWSAIKRLHIHPMRIENFHLEAEKILLVAVHSHANLAAAVKVVKAEELAVIAIPCCVTQTLLQEPDLQYEDKGIISPCRTVKIWKRIDLPKTYGVGN